MKVKFSTEYSLLAEFLSLQKYYGNFRKVSKGETEAAHIDRVFMGG